jgi:hypothetical protein
MKQDAQVPLMTELERRSRRSSATTATPSRPPALVMLRETGAGRLALRRGVQGVLEEVDVQAPATGGLLPDASRTASGEQLNYFWRGWFYTTYANDQSIAAVESQAGDSLLGPAKAGQTYYRVKIENKGGLVLPLQIEVTYDDGTKELVKLPADVWRRNELAFTYGFFSKKTVTQVVLDPKEALADVDRSNNTWKKPNTVS